MATGASHQAQQSPQEPDGGVGVRQQLVLRIAARWRPRAFKNSCLVTSGPAESAGAVATFPKPQLGIKAAVGRGAETAEGLMSSGYNAPCCLGKLAGARAGGRLPTSISGLQHAHRTVDYINQVGSLAGKYETDTRSKSLLCHLLTVDPVQLHDLFKPLFLS